MNVEKFNKNIIIPKKLKEARIARGMSMQELANKINVTRQAISQFELGIIVPKYEVFTEITRVLDFPKVFFTSNRKPKNNNSNGAIFFRSLKSASRLAREMMKCRIEWVEYCLDYLQEFINFPQTNLQELLKIDELTITGEDRIEEIANNLRQYWGLGYGPINNLTNILEKKGFVITFINHESDKIDSFSQLRNGRYFILLNRNERSAVRLRFDLAHELGHLLLHNNGEEINDKSVLDRIEKEANSFAGAFLFPRDSAISDINSTTLNHLITLKEKWKISIAAIVFRAGELGIFNDNQVTYLNRQLSYNKMRKKEPLDSEIRIEEPLAFRQAIDLILNNNIKTAYEISKVDLPYGNEELESLLNLEKNTLAIYDNIIDLSLKKDSYYLKPLE